MLYIWSYPVSDFTFQPDFMVIPRLGSILMAGFKLILGTPLNATPKPWLLMDIPGVMVNAFELLRYGNFSALRGSGLRKLLGIQDLDVELWIDSGGYQFLSRGIDPGVEKIARLYREIDADYYVSLDYPPSPSDSPVLQRLKITKTIHAYLTLRSRLRDLAESGRLVPVFHLSVGATLQLQLRQYEATATVASVGGLVPYFMQRAGRHSRLKAVLFLIMLRKLWDGHLHALGLASTAIIPLLRLIGIDSGDTQTWRHKAAYGKIVIPGIGERHVSNRKVNFGPSVLRPEEEEVFKKITAEAYRWIRISREELAKSFEARALFNAWILLVVSKNGHHYNGPSAPFAKLYENTRKLLEASPMDLEEALARLLRQALDTSSKKTWLQVVSDRTGVNGIVVDKVETG